jgi:hypothetical protein
MDDTGLYREQILRHAGPVITGSSSVTAPRTPAR